MNEKKYVDDVRTRLVLAGIGELSERGVKEFSLRRVAISAQVSCAAPYRHFESKADLILEVIRYICSRHDMFTREVENAFPTDRKRAVTELAVATLRFWGANGSFRTVLTADNDEGCEDRRRELRRFDDRILRILAEHCHECGISDAESERVGYLILTLIYGSVSMVGAGKMSSELAASLLRSEIERILP